jgi:hypothetical protein
VATYFRWFPVGGSGESIVLGHEMPYILQNRSGLLSTLSTPQTQKAPFQIGETLLDVSVSPRVVPLTVYVHGYTLEEVNTNRAALARAFSVFPSQHGATRTTGTLRIYRDGFDPLDLPAIPRGSPDETEIGINCVVSIELFCPYPYWQATSESYRKIRTIDGLEFPIEFPFEIPSRRATVFLDNPGDVPAPVTAVLWGAADTVRMINETTGETLEVRGHISAGDWIVVTTGFGNKAITYFSDLGATSENWLSHLNLTKAEFWSLAPGCNSITFEGDGIVDGYMDLYFKPRYSGV